MLFTESRRSAAEFPRRPTVRIVKRRQISRAAAFSLLITAAAAMFAFFTWRFWKDDFEAVPVQRSLSDVTLTYRCEQGDVFRAQGQPTPARCPSCNRPAYPITAYVCETHGPQEAIVRFNVDLGDQASVSEVRILPGGDWHSAADGVRCPRCGSEMFRKADDGLDLSKYKKRESDGGPQRQPPPTGPEGPRHEDREPPNDHPSP